MNNTHEFVSIGQTIRKITTVILGEYRKIINELSNNPSPELKRTKLKLFLKELQDVLIYLYKFTKNCRKFNNLKNIIDVTTYLYSYYNGFNFFMDQIYNINSTVCELYVTPNVNLNSAIDLINNNLHQDLKKDIYNIISTELSQSVNYYMADKQKRFEFMEKYLYKNPISYKYDYKLMNKKSEFILNINNAINKFESNNNSNNIKIRYDKNNFYISFYRLVMFKLYPYIANELDNLGKPKKKFFYFIEQTYYNKTHSAFQQINDENYIKYQQDFICKINGLDILNMNNNNNLSNNNEFDEYGFDFKFDTLISIMDTFIKEHLFIYLYNFYKKKIFKFITKFTMPIKIEEKKDNSNNINNYCPIIKIEYTPSEYLLTEETKGKFYINIIPLLDNQKIKIITGLHIVSTNPFIYVDENEENHSFENFDYEKVITKNLEEFELIIINRIYENLQNIPIIFLPFSFIFQTNSIFSDSSINSYSSTNNIFNQNNNINSALMDIDFNDIKRPLLFNDKTINLIIHRKTNLNPLLLFSIELSSQGDLIIYDNNYYFGELEIKNLNDMLKKYLKNSSSLNYILFNEIIFKSFIQSYFSSNELMVNFSYYNITTNLVLLSCIFKKFENQRDNAKIIIKYFIVKNNHLNYNNNFNNNYLNICEAKIIFYKRNIDTKHLECNILQYFDNKNYTLDIDGFENLFKVIKKIYKKAESLIKNYIDLLSFFNIKNEYIFEQKNINSNIININLSNDVFYDINSMNDDSINIVLKDRNLERIQEFFKIREDSMQEVNENIFYFQKLISKIEIISNKFYFKVYFNREEINKLLKVEDNTEIENYSFREGENVITFNKIEYSLSICILSKLILKRSIEGNNCRKVIKYLIVKLIKFIKNASIMIKNQGRKYLFQDKAKYLISPICIQFKTNNRKIIVTLNSDIFNNEICIHKFMKISIYPFNSQFNEYDNDSFKIFDKLDGKNIYDKLDFYFFLDEIKEILKKYFISNVFYNSNFPGLFYNKKIFFNIIDNNSFDIYCHNKFNITIEVVSINQIDIFSKYSFNDPRLSKTLELLQNIKNHICINSSIVNEQNFYFNIYSKRKVELQTTFENILKEIINFG